MVKVEYALVNDGQSEASAHDPPTNQKLGLKLISMKRE